MKYNQLLFFTLISGATGLFFQNCGQLTLKPKVGASTLSNFSIQSSICSSFDAASNVSKYTVTDFFAVNLSVNRSNGQFVIDKNMNGMNDQLEVDSNIPAIVTVGSLDSDGDGIPDFIEILKGTNPYRNDALEDGADNDGVQNFREIQFGTDPGYPDAGESYITSSLSLLAEKNSACGAGQDSLQLRLDLMPLLQMEAYTDATNSGDWNLSHGQDENVIFIGYKAIASNTKTNQPVFRGKILKIKPGQKAIALSPADFTPLP